MPRFQRYPARSGPSHFIAGYLILWFVGLCPRCLPPPHIAGLIPPTPLLYNSSRYLRSCSHPYAVPTPPCIWRSLRTPFPQFPDYEAVGTPPRVYHAVTRHTVAPDTDG